MNDFVDDPLAKRLTNLALPMDPAALAGRVLAARQRESRPRLRMRAAVAFVPLLLAIFATVASYYAPAFAQALADAPVAGGITGPFLRSAGLAGVAHRITSLTDTASSSGYRAHLVGGYADSGVTVLLLRVTPGARLVPVGAGPTPDVAVTLRDQFGTAYRLTGSTSQSDTGETAVYFTPLVFPANVVGARLALSFNTLEDRAGVSPRIVPGDWTLRGTLAIEPSRDLPLPPDAQLGAVRVSFTQVRAHPAVVLIEMRVTGTDIASFTRIVPDGFKGHPAFAASLSGADGRERQGLQAGTREDHGAIVVIWMWQVDGDGRYQLALSYEGAGRETREIDVR